MRNHSCSQVRWLGHTPGSVELHGLPKENGDFYARRFGLLRDEDIYLARKPSVKTASMRHSLPPKERRDYATDEYASI